VSVGLPAAGALIPLPRGHLQTQTGGEAAAAERVFILPSWPPWQEGRQARQAQRWGVYRGTQLIASPGLPFPPAGARSFPTTVSLSTEIPFKTCFRSPRREAPQAHGSQKCLSCCSRGGSDLGQDRGGSGPQQFQPGPGPVLQQRQQGTRGVAPLSVLANQADLINNRSVFPDHMLSCIQNTFVGTSIFNAIYAKCCCKKQPLT